MSARVALSIAVSGAAALALTGCGFITPIATQEEYDPGDGVSAELGGGDIDLEGILVISEDGDLGNLLMAAVNTTDTDEELLVQYESNGTPTTLTIELPASTTTPVGFGDAGQLALEGIDSDPGSLIKIYFEYGDAEGELLSVPVLDGSFPEYSELVPTPTPTVTLLPTEEPTDAATTDEESDEG